MITNKLFAIGIPTINRADLLNPALEKYVEDFPNTRIMIFDNGDQPIVNLQNPDVAIVRKYDIEKKKSENIGVAASWNVLCSSIFASGISFAWIMNDDIYSGRKEHEIREYLEQEQEADFDFITPLGNWSNFIISRDCYRVTGPFDEGFYPAYFEDNDYRYRMKLLRARYTAVTLLNPEILRVSS